MQNSVIQFIKDLYNNKELINYLFENRKLNISLDSLSELSFWDPDKLGYLTEKSLLSENSDNISLDVNLLEFLENFLNISDQINTAYISETVKELENNILFYMEETREKEKQSYLSKIKRYLKGISRNISREIINLKRNIDIVYKTEQNFKIKTKKLEDYRQKRDNIIELKLSIEYLLASKRNILESVGDKELNSIILSVYNILEESYTYLIEIQQELIEYINKSKIYGEIFRKTQKLKQLKDQQEIRYKTNILKVIKAEKALLLQPRKTFYSKISTNFLQSDEGFSLIKKLAYKKLQQSKKLEPSSKIISEEYFNASEEVEEIIDLKSLKKLFWKSEQDLFSFIIKLETTKDFTLSERISIFCKMISEFEDELEVKEEMGNHENFYYALAYPGKK